MIRKLAVFLGFSLGLLSLSACNFSLAADVTPPPGYQAPAEVETTPTGASGSMFPVVPPDPAKGAAIYAEKCAPCHGVGGMGDGPNAAALPSPVTALGNPDVAHQATPSDWFSIVTNGNLDRFMPPFRSLSDRQRWDVVAYALSLSNPPDELARGMELFGAECAACHGQAGAGDGPQAANLSVPNLAEQERMAARSEADLFEVITSGAGDRMPAYAERLSEADRWALAGYLRTLTFSIQQASAPVAVTPLAITPPAVNLETPPGQRGTPVAPSGSEVTATVVASETVSATLPGAITGQISLASGAPAPSGLEVNLHAFSQMDLVYTQTAVTGPDGAYIFDQIDLQPGLAFLSTVEFGGVVYGSDVIVAKDGGSLLDLPIEVFETTTDTAALSVDRLHYFFEFVDQDTLRVLELYVISNSSDKTIRAAEKGQPVISFTLPSGAANLQFEDGALGDRYVEIPGGFADTVPIRPSSGQHQVLFSYEMPYQRKLELLRTTPLLTQAVIILAPQQGIKVRGENLEDAGAREIQGVQYQMYNAPAMGAGSELRLTISGNPGGGGFTLSASPTSNVIIGLAALGIVLLTAGAWVFNRTRRWNPPDEDDELLDDSSPVLNTREAVMDAILALDDSFQEGKLQEDAYLRRRAVLKARLKEITVQ